MRRVIGRAKLACEQAGERLHLVASGEQREFLGVGGAYLLQAFGEDGKRLFPADRLEISGAAFGAFFAQQGLCQSGGRVLLHDAGTALGTNHTIN